MLDVVLNLNTIIFFCLIIAANIKIFQTSNLAIDFYDSNILSSNPYFRHISAILNLVALTSKKTSYFLLEIEEEQLTHCVNSSLLAVGDFKFL